MLAARHEHSAALRAIAGVHHHVTLRAMARSADALVRWIRAYPQASTIGCGAVVRIKVPG
jgi:hypothetical protein